MSENRPFHPETANFDETSRRNFLADDLADLAGLRQDMERLRRREQAVLRFIADIHENLPKDAAVYTYTQLPMTNVLQRNPEGIYESVATLFTGETHRPFIGNDMALHDDSVLVVNHELGLAIPTAIAVGRTDLEVDTGAVEDLYEDFMGYLPKLQRQIALGNKAIFIDSLIKKD